MLDFYGEKIEAQSKAKEKREDGECQLPFEGRERGRIDYLAYSFGPSALFLVVPTRTVVGPIGRLPIEPLYRY